MRYLLALAAHAVLAAGARHLLILDLDAHCGGGTYSIVRDWPGVVELDISVSGFDDFTPDAAGRSTLDMATDAKDYLPMLRRRLAALDDIGFDVVLYNAGMDVYEGCDIGGLEGITRPVLAEREQIVFESARSVAVPLAFVLAGGYVGRHLEQEALVGCIA